MRRRWVQINGKLVPVDGDYVQMGESVVQFHILGDKNYQGLTSPIDGAVIDTRTKYKTYVKEKNLALVDDFKNEFKKAEENRVAGKDTTRKQDVIAAVNKHYRS